MGVGHAVPVGCPQNQAASTGAFGGVTGPPTTTASWRGALLLLNPTKAKTTKMVKPAAKPIFERFEMVEPSFFLSINGLVSSMFLIS
jgi:hypothetical protein